LGRQADGMQNLNVGAASAQIVFECLSDLIVGGIRTAIEQRLGRHDHAIEAIAALSCLCRDEGLLDWMQTI
jgi:hypothetical protein